MLTEKTVATSKAPETGQRFLRDSKTPGLALRITAGGSKAFVWEGRVRGRSRRVTLGAPPVMSLPRARQKALEIASQAADGMDPAVAIAAERGEVTFGRLCELYIERHVLPHKRPASAYEDKRMLRGCLSIKDGVDVAQEREPDLIPRSWASRRLSDIDRGLISQLHARIGQERGRYAANRCLALLGSMFSQAALWDLHNGPNPTTGIKKFREQSRERYLSPDELRRFLQAIEAEPEHAWRSYFMLALLLGPRKSELLSAKWSDVDLKARTWRMPTTKAGRSHLIPLPEPAVAILEALPRPEGEWVFPSKTSSSGHLETPTRPWNRIRAAAGIKDVRLHDLRRTLGSWLASSGYGLPLIGKILNHTNASTTQVYARLALDPLRQALEANARAMLGARADGGRDEDSRGFPD